MQCVRFMTIVICFIFIPLFHGASNAADYEMTIEIPSSPNPVGSGARALGMGGAFISVADDATAASWNPAGLVQLATPEISVVYDVFHRKEENRFGLSPDSSGEDTVSKGRVNYASAVHPFQLFGRAMVASVNYQKLYDFSRQWDFLLNAVQKDFGTTQTVNYYQDGELSAVGFAFGAQITPRLSFGVTLNVWNNDLTPNEWEEETIQSGVGVDGNKRFAFQSYAYDRYEFKGINANIGILWIIGPQVSFGAVVKTPFEADLFHDHRMKAGVQYPDAPGASERFHNDFNSKNSLKMPMSYGVGVSYRPFHNWMMALDFYRTEWDDFALKDENGRKTSPINGKPIGETDIAPTCQVRMGVEYLHIADRFILPVTAGVFYDPAPAEGSPDDIYGFSLGAGVGYKIIHFDIAYQYRFGNDVGDAMLTDHDFSQDIQEHVIYTSLVVHF